MLLNCGRGLLRDDRKRALRMLPSLTWQMISYIALPRNKGSQTITTMAVRHSITRIECRRMRRAALTHSLTPYLDLLSDTRRAGETVHGRRQTPWRRAMRLKNPRG